MSVFVDTNVLLRSRDASSPQYATATAALAELRRRNEEVLLCLQNLAEFWAIATKTTAYRGFGWTAAEADAAIGGLLTGFTFLPDPPDTHLVWRKLVTTRNVRGTNVHDARLAATALAAGVADLLTFNRSDFAPFAADGLNPLDPATV